ncbi:MAG: hypothetical protein ABI603_04245 [Acidobacteriota bacterium]
MDTETLTRILLDVVNGVPAPAGEPAEHTEARRQLQVEVDEIAAMGGIVDIPFELP